MICISNTTNRYDASLLTNVPATLITWVSYYVDRLMYNKKHPDLLPRYPKLVHVSVLEIAGISMEEFMELVNKEVEAITAATNT